MREHMGLYRGKRMDNGEWVEGNLFVPDEVTHRKAPTEILVGTNVVRISCEVDPDTVGECTGLRDKNGKLIFEGDKLIPFNNDIDKMVVEFHDGTFTLCLYGDRGYRSESGDWEYDGSNYGVIEREPLTSYGDEIVVCGTIHDNPELLKGGEQ